ncbi:MAG: hypothetical protein LBG82_09265 [Clostridiales Family XIII bacterium]|jgi:hypothetical protein|nr:hypothetical protein [Clostridiales Family XIII bacterium]
MNALLLKSKSKHKLSAAAAIVLTSILMMAVFIPAAALADEESGSVDVATAEELMEAVNDSNASVINLTASSYQLKPQAGSSATYADEGYLQPNRSIRFVSKNGATIKNAANKRHMYIMYRAGSITLTFDNVTLKGNSGGGILYTARGGTLTLDGANISGCTANDIDRASHVGGAVETMGNIVLNDCTLTGNSAVEASSPYAGGKIGGDGGAIYADGTITANDCTVKNNSSVAGKGVSKYGGAFYSDSGIEINGGEYSGNSAPEGGAVGIKAQNGATLSIMNAEMSGNTAKYGGAVMSNVGMYAVNVRFIGNKADRNGGAVDSRGGFDTIISGCTFEGNEAASGNIGYGGAVDVDGEGGYALIEGTDFSGNSAGHGGTVSFDDNVDAIVNDCTLTDGSAGFGGGIYCGYARLDIEGSVIEHNSANEGGAMYVYSNWMLPLGVNIGSTRIADNMAVDTAGIYTDDIRLINTRDSVFADNVSDNGCQWNLDNALADGYADALTHSSNIIGTAYTSPYKNAYNNVDITYYTSEWLYENNDGGDEDNDGGDEDNGGGDEDNGGGDEDNGGGDATGPAIVPIAPIDPIGPNVPADPSAPYIVNPNAPSAPSVAPSAPKIPQSTSSTTNVYNYVSGRTPNVTVASRGAAPVAEKSIAPVQSESTLGNQSVPFAGIVKESSWSLINLIMTVATVFMMAFSLLAAIVRRKDDCFTTEEEMERMQKKSRRMKLLSIVPAAIILPMFVILEDMSKQMVYADKWTSLFISILLAQAALMIHNIANSKAVSGGVEL